MECIKNNSMGYDIDALSNIHQKDIGKEPKIHYNTPCLKCGQVFETMVRINPIVLCDWCYFDESTTMDINMMHSKWIEIYKEKG